MEHNNVMDGGKNIDALSGSGPALSQVEAPIAEPDKDQKKDLFSWTSQNFVLKEKGVWWYAAATALVLLICAWFLWQEDWFSVGVIIVVTAVIFWYGKSARPIEVSHSISDLGITSSGHFYPFSEIHSYWIVYNEKVSTLYVAFLKKYLPSLVINLSENDPQKIRMILSGFIPEQEKRGENLVDKLIRIIGL